MRQVNYNKLREMIARCKWTFAKTMPFAPHEYIGRDKCPLTDKEFVYFVDMQREYGVKERWGKYNNPYLYIDDYKYWTMDASMEDTKVMNRAKACVVDDAHKLYGGMKESEGSEYVDEYIHEKLGLKPKDKSYNINLISGRLGEIDACANHLRRIRNNYCNELINEWSKRLSKDFPNQKSVSLLTTQMLCIQASPSHIKTFQTPLLSAYKLKRAACFMVLHICQRYKKCEMNYKQA